jgi:radical SAM protein with 4Fe4S-binding SPASM domain
MADEAEVSLVKFHVFSGIGLGNENKEWLISPREWIEFYHQLEELRGQFNTQIWYQPTYALRSEVARFSDEGYRGCIGRTLDRISVFPDGRAYVCSYLFDTALNYAFVDDDQVRLNKGENEFDLFSRVLEQPSCGKCKAPSVCLGGCPAEELALGGSSCADDPEIVPVCRLWKSEL